MAKMPVKFIKRAKKAVKKRYFKNGTPKVATMARDIMRIKAMLNTEKKMFPMSLDQGFAGIQNGAGQGFLARNISPDIAQGVTETARVGAKIKIVSFQYRCLIAQNNNQSAPIRWTHYLIRQAVSHHDLSNDAQLERFIENDPFYSKKSYFSMRNPDGNDYKLFTIISKRSGTVKPDTVSGVAQTACLNIFKKSQFHMKWAGDTTGLANIEQNPIYSIWVTDSGDIDAGVQTGININEMCNWYYVNN